MPIVVVLMKHVENAFVGLVGKRIFSKIDLLRAVHEIPVGERDISKTAAPYSLYEFLVITFGRPVLPAIYGRNIN